MKKILSVLTILTLAFTMSVNAQTKKSQTEKWVEKQETSIFIAGGVFVSEDVAIENLEVGKTFGSNTIALVGQTYRVSTPSDRVWSTGVKYYRTVYKSGPFAFQANGSVLVNLTGSYNFLTFKPGVSTSVALTKKMAIQASVSSPIYEGTTLFKPTNFEGGLQVVIAL